MIITRACIMIIQPLIITILPVPVVVPLPWVIRDGVLAVSGLSLCLGLDLSFRCRRLLHLLFLPGGAKEGRDRSQGEAPEGAQHARGGGGHQGESGAGLEEKT